MTLTKTGWEYRSTEQTFVEYFDRLKATGMSYDEIQSKLPQLQPYYFEMVVSGKIYFNQSTVEELFINWKEYTKIKTK